MAVSVLNYATKTVNDRLIRSSITVKAGDDDYNAAAFTVPIGTPLTLVVAASAVSTGSTVAKLQGSVDGVNWVTLKDIIMDSDSAGDLTAAGVIAETHLPSTNGSWPWYRLASDMAASNGSAYTAWILQG